MINDCIHNHDGCNRTSRFKSRMPTRLLLIHDEYPEARLIDTLGEPNLFVALSYCWGKNNVNNLTLTKDTERSLRQGLPFEKFPRTLRDALLVTQKLKVRYLWIDAICIFQDSPVDWIEESARMRDVYSGALFTIDAATATGSDVGMFCKRQPPGPRCILEWRNGQALPQFVYLRSASEFSDTTLRDSATSKRAWTLQEDLLAPRTLHFGAQQISFDCAQGRFDECGRHTAPTQIYNDKRALQDFYYASSRRVALWRRLKLPLEMDIPYYSFTHSSDRAYLDNKALFRRRLLQVIRMDSWTRSNGEIITSHRHWGEIVFQFTSRSMTEAGDVLPALAGLAEQFQHIKGGDDYVAGMWKGDLSSTLGWHRLTPSELLATGGEGMNAKTLPRPTQYLAPSWSWAAVLGGIVLFPNLWTTPRNETLSVRPHIRIKKVHIETAGHQPFGKILSGYLVLEGPIHDIRSPEETEPDTQLPITHGRLQERLLHHEDFSYEFHQQHQPYVGQKFAVLHLNSNLLKDNLRKSTRNTYLLLESVSDKSWKRVGEFGASQNEYLQKSSYEPVVEEVEYQRLFQELSAAQWKRRSMHLV